MLIIKSSSNVLLQALVIASEVWARIIYLIHWKMHRISPSTVRRISSSFLFSYVVRSSKAKNYLLTQHTSLSTLDNRMWLSALRMELVPNEIYNKCKVATKCQRVSMEKLENLISNFYTEYLLIFGYNKLNKVIKINFICFSLSFLYCDYQKI